VQPRPAALTYLAHSNPYAQHQVTNAPNAVLSHFISTSGRSGFDQLFTAWLKSPTGQFVQLRETWPLFVTVPSRADAFDGRLTARDPSVAAVLHGYDALTGLPTELPCTIELGLDYYAGISDGFAGYGTMCFDAPGSSGPRSPTTCM
jgi:hypothetical protein